VLEDIPNKSSIGALLVELRVCCVQLAIPTIAGPSLAPDVPQPIRAQTHEVKSLFCPSYQKAKFNNTCRVLKNEEAFMIPTSSCQTPEKTLRFRENRPFITHFGVQEDLMVEMGFAA
jgi:hypothetical protein